MAKIIAIVEGDGEVEAVPALIRRIHAEVAPGVPLEVGRPVRVRRNRGLQDGELERYVGLAANLAGADGCILVLLDANGACPANLGPDILQRARTARPDRRVEAVVAKCEYESRMRTSAAATPTRGSHRKRFAFPAGNRSRQ